MLSYPDFTPALRYDYDRSRIDGPGSTSEYMMKGHTSSCLSVELSPNARYLASGGTDSVICLWDTQDWICQRTFTDMIGPVKSLSMSISPEPLFTIFPTSSFTFLSGQPLMLVILHRFHLRRLLRLWRQ